MAIRISNEIEKLIKSVIDHLGDDISPINDLADWYDDIEDGTRDPIGALEFGNKHKDIWLATSEDSLTTWGFINEEKAIKDLKELLDSEP